MDVKKIWIDTDTGVDDAIAMFIASKTDCLDVVGISAVAGNAELNYTFKNARNVVYMAGKDYKVYKGADKPLIYPLRTAPMAHGVNGLGDATIPESDAPVENKPAWDALYEKAKELNGELNVVAIGPLTNIALTLRVHPDFKDYCKEIFIMGGVATGGNATPCAEFNIYADPHAAREVFESGIFINMFGLDVTEKALLVKEDIEEIISYNNPPSNLFRDSTSYLLKLYESQHMYGLCEHDSCPIIYLIHPELFKYEDCGVYVEADSEFTRGETVVDIWSNIKFKDRHCRVFLDVDREKFAQVIKDVYKQF